MQQREELTAAPARRDHVAYFGIEGQQADAVALVIREVSQACREHLRVVALLDVGRSVIHRLAHIENDENASVGLALELLDEELVAAAVDVPVDATDFIAGLV